MKVFIYTLTLCLIISCAQKASTPTAVKTPNNAPVNVTVPAIIYKTTGSYWQNIPVMLSDDKTQIVSYPHPKDVFFNGKLTTPSPLPDGYWLDNRGISANVAFTSWTYETYSRLETPPSVSDLFNAIIDKNPIAEMWHCGSRAAFETPIELSLKKIMKQKEWPQTWQRLK